MHIHPLSPAIGHHSHLARPPVTTPRHRLADAYAELYKEHKATHALTIALGVHPVRFDPETELLPQLRRIAREIAQRLRGVPKRQLMRLRPEDAVWMAGFYEPRNGAGELYPHFHGVISLRNNEESALRGVLTDTVGADSAFRGAVLVPPTRRVVSTPGAKPSFDLQPLSGTSGYIRYATKQARGLDVTHWTINDILAYS